MTPRHKFYIGFFIGGIIVCAGLHAFACEIGRDETGNDTFGMNICASNTAMCIYEDKYIDCADIPVMELSEEDLQEQPPSPEEQWAALVKWRGVGE
jgi:hypothetical protein